MQLELNIRVLSKKVIEATDLVHASNR